MQSLQKTLTINTQNKNINIVKLFCFYLLFTIFLYIFGPYKWQTHNTFLTFLLIFLYMVAFHFGGKSALKREIVKPYEEGVSKYYFEFIDFYYLFAIVTIALSIVALQRVISLYGLSGLTELFERMQNDYKSLYFSTGTADTGAEMYGGALFSIAAAVFSPITILFIPFTILSFNDLNFGKKIVGIVAIVLRILSSISKGSNYSIFTIIVPIFVALFIRSQNKAKKKKTKNNKRSFWFIIAVVVILYLFYAVMDNRMGGRISFIQIGENTVDQSNWLLNILPGDFRKLLMWMEFYLCQGYYGFSLATEVSWIPMFGMGSSRWLCLELDGLLNVYEDTYVFRIGQQFNWDASANWHTAYTWFANDVGLLGVIIVMFLIGYFLQRSFDNSRKTLNPFSLGLLSLLVQLVAFLPCNNLIFSDSKTLIAFVVYFLGYVVTENVVVSGEVHKK